jgi:hypothetical protein
VCVCECVVCVSASVLGSQQSILKSRCQKKTSALVCGPM